MYTVRYIKLIWILFKNWNLFNCRYTIKSELRNPSVFIEFEVVSTTYQQHLPENSKPTRAITSMSVTSDQSSPWNSIFCIYLMKYHARLVHANTTRCIHIHECIINIHRLLHTMLDGQAMDQCPIWKSLHALTTLQSTGQSKSIWLYSIPYHLTEHSPYGCSGCNTCTPQSWQSMQPHLCQAFHRTVSGPLLSSPFQSTIWWGSWLIRKDPLVRKVCSIEWWSCAFVCEMDGKLTGGDKNWFTYVYLKRDKDKYFFMFKYYKIEVEKTNKWEDWNS